jgi:redox-sensitive bicupin YhaK (pirin superfamily)
MSDIRKIFRVWRSQPTLEGAGVHLRRAFGNREVSMLDPFLLLDDFRSKNPVEYMKGFPWHPHRGIETITYMLEGSLKHGDSMENGGLIGAGDVQWMTAGSGIIHEEMPQITPSGIMGGFQLWANLPAKAKMMDPRYRDVKNEDIVSYSLDNGGKVRIIAGQIENTVGPVQDIVTAPEYFDVSLPSESKFTHPIKRGHNAFAYVFEGGGFFDESQKELLENYSLVIFDQGDAVQITTKNHPVRFLLASGRPLMEPVAWYGPIVMNTQAELDIAFREYRKGTFIKYKKPIKKNA